MSVKQMVDLVSALEADLSEYRPERRLLLSILIRALSDLEVNDSHIRKSAYVWFETPGNAFPHGFTYSDIVELTDLDATYTEGIAKVLRRKKKISLYNKRRRTNI